MFRISFAPSAPFRTVLFATSAIVALTAPPPALADDAVSMGVNTCTTLNCGSKVIEPRINAQATFANPWVGLFWAAGGSTYCARLQIDRQTLDTEMSVVAPDGRVYTSNNYGQTCPQCPRVVISPVSLRGVYTVVVNHWLGTAVEGSFRLRVSQYKLTNPNCGNPTLPSLPTLSTAETAKIRKAKGN